MTHTAQDLLVAVGVEWKQDAAMHRWDNGLTSTQIYTGPALGTPDLDAVLLVEGGKKLRDIDEMSTTDAESLIDRIVDKLPAYWFISRKPGHALAAAIAEVAG